MKEKSENENEKMLEYLNFLAIREFELFMTDDVRVCVFQDSSSQK